MKTLRKILLYTGLIASLLGKAESQQNRVTELSSFPRLGIANAKVVFDKDFLRLQAYTDAQGYYDINHLTEVNEDEASKPSKFAKINAAGNKVIFSNLEQQTELTIYSILGQEIYHAKASNSIAWDKKNNHGMQVAKGVYIYKLEDASRVEYGKIIPGENFVDVGVNRYIAEKNKKLAGSLSKGNLTKEGAGNVTHVADTIYCDPKNISKSTHHLEDILMQIEKEKNAARLSKGGVGQVIYRMSKDTSFYAIEDTLDDMSKLPGNSQLLENVDMGKPDAIRSLEYVKLFTNGSANYGEYETSYPVPVFLDSVAIYQRGGAVRGQMYLTVLRSIIKEANDSTELNKFREVNNVTDTKVRLSYDDPQGGTFVLTYYNIDANGNSKIDSARIYLSPSFNDSAGLKTIAGHEFTHVEVSEHSRYGDDITSTNFTIPNKSYSKADKYLFRVLPLARPGTKWKIFKK